MLPKKGPGSLGESMDITEWLKSTAALISAFGALFAGMAALWPHLKRRGKPVRARRHWLLWSGIALVALAVSIFAARIIGERYTPLNSKLTTQAWDAFNRSDFNAAISAADECVSRFRSSAERQESALQNESPPPVGKTSDEQKNALLARGVLNDVATCFFIRGESASKLGRTTEAMDAYTAAGRYPHARVFDPRGNFFWSPADAAADRLKDLQK
jgi:hypothetical protein